MSEQAPIEVLFTVPFPPASLQELQNISPRLHFNFLTPHRAEDVPAEAWARCRVLYTDRTLPTPAPAPLLEWIEVHYAGIDFAPDAPILHKSSVQATTLSGAAAPQVAEYCLTMMLALGHHLPTLFRLQSKAEWPAERWERLSPRELRGSTVALVGYGSIGRELARLLQPFNVKILAIKRNVMQPQDNGYIAPGLGDPQGDLFTRLYPIEALRSVLKQSDFIVLTLPLSPATRGLIEQETLESVKPGAFLIDVGRGGIVEPMALLNALQEKRLSGAALDVFAEEPLPASSPFWKLPNVIISPHIAGFSPNYHTRAMQMFAENLQRYLNGEPLLNVYDPHRGY
jgi:phosphoglycerate dehydrogenase-like enzyme